MNSADTMFRRRCCPVSSVRHSIVRDPLLIIYAATATGLEVSLLIPPQAHQRHVNSAETRLLNAGCCERIAALKESGSGLAPE